MTSPDYRMSLGFSLIRKSIRLPAHIADADEKKECCRRLDFYRKFHAHRDDTRRCELTRFSV